MKISQSHGWLAALFLLPVPALGQYTIDWFTVDGGGSMSTGGIYQLSGTMGQPDGGSLAGGNFSLAGGYWSLITVVPPVEPPNLTIAGTSPGNATISWTPSSPGFVLQETPTIAPAAWTNSLSGATNPVSVPASGKKYFRLIKPN